MRHALYAVLYFIIYNSATSSFQPLNALRMQKALKISTNNLNFHCNFSAGERGVEFKWSLESRESEDVLLALSSCGDFFSLKGRTKLFDKKTDKLIKETGFSTSFSKGKLSTMKRGERGLSMEATCYPADVPLLKMTVNIELGDDNHPDMAFFSGIFEFKDETTSMLSENFDTVHVVDDITIFSAKVFDSKGPVINTFSAHPDEKSSLYRSPFTEVFLDKFQNEIDVSSQFGSLAMPLALVKYPVKATFYAVASIVNFAITKLLPLMPTSYSGMRTRTRSQAESMSYSVASNTVSADSFAASVAVGSSCEVFEEVGQEKGQEKAIQNVQEKTTEQQVQEMTTASSQDTATQAVPTPSRWTPLNIFQLFLYQLKRNN